MRVEPTTENKEFQNALTSVIGNEGKDLDSAVILAITANLVGRLIAMQDQRKYTSAQIMKMVGENIEQGNKEVIEGLLNEPTGEAQ
jgi:hypothetical protein